MFKKKLRSILKPYRRRLRIEALWKSVTLGLAFGIVISAVILALAKMIHHTAEYQLALIVGGVVAVLFTGLYYSLWCRPHWKDTTACVDALGLQERVTTMFTLGDNDSAISKLQREDTLEKLALVKPRQLKIRFLSRQLLAIAISLLLFGTAMLMPLFNANASDTSAITAEQRRIIDELVTALKEKIAGLEVDANTRDQLNKVIDNLEQDLPSCKTYVDKIARITKASDEINIILKSLLTKNIIGAALSKYEITRELGKAIINGDIEAVKTACENLKNQFAKVTGDSYISLLKNLSESLYGALNLSKNAGVSTTDELYTAINTFAEDSGSALIDANHGTDVSKQVNAAIDKAMDAIIAALKKQNKTEAAMKEMNKLIGETKDKLVALEQETESSSTENNETTTSETETSQPPKQSNSSGDMPGGANGDSPAGTDGDSPRGANGDSPAGTDGDSPSGANGDSPTGTDGDSPGGANGDSPAGTDGDAPGGANGDSPAGTDGDSPGGANGGSAANPNGNSPAGTNGDSPTGTGGTGSGDGGTGGTGGSGGRGSGGSGGTSNIPEKPVTIYDPDSGAVPYEDVYDEYYANALSGMNEKNVDSGQKDVVDGYFNSLK